MSFQLIQAIAYALLALGYALLAVEVFMQS
jgi:hypothetical protein